MKQILVFGRHAAILETVLHLINQTDDYQAIGCLSDDDAIQLIKKNNFDLILIGGGVELISENKIRLLVKNESPRTIVIQHFGGGSGLLFNELQAAFSHING